MFMANKTVKTRFQIKRGTSADWAAATNFTPLEGEIIFYSDLNKFKVGKKDSDGNLILLSELPFSDSDTLDGKHASEFVLEGDSRLTDSRTPKSHASSSTTYGVATTSKYGHVKISNGDVASVASANGLAAGMDHSHSNYASSSHTHSGTYSGSFTPAGSVTVTPNTTTVNSITGVGTLPSLTYESITDLVTITDWDAGSTPTRSSFTYVSGASGNDTFLKEINAGSGSLTSDTTSTNGIKYVESVTHTAASLGSPSTSSAAPGGHTHTYDKASTLDMGVNTTSTGGTKFIQDVSHTAASLTGTTTFNTDAIKSVALSASTTSTDGPTYVQSISGSAPSLGGTKTFVTGVTAGSGSLTSNTTSTGGIKYVESVSSNSVSSEEGDVASSGHTHTYTKPTGVSLGSNTTASGGVAYVASISSSAASASGTKSAAPGGHTHTFSGVSEINSGTPVTAVTGVGADGTATVLTGVKATGTYSVAPVSHTHQVTASGTITLTPGTAPSLGSATTKYLSASFSGTEVTSGINTLAAVEALVGSLDGTTLTLTTAEVAAEGHKHSVTASGSVSLSANTSTATGRVKYVEAQGTFTAGTTPKSSASFTGTAVTSQSSGTSVDVVSGVGADGTATVLTGVKATGTAKAAPEGHYHDYGGTTEANSGTNFNAVTGVTGGGASATTKYFHPSITTESASTGSPSGTTSVVTSVSGGGASGTTKYLHHTHTSASSAGTGTVTLSGGSYSATTRYMKATGTAASTGTVGISGGSISKTTRYFHPTFTYTSTNTGSNSGTNFNAVTGYGSFSGGGVTPTTKYLHHSHTGASSKTTASAVTGLSTGTAYSITGVGSKPSLTYEPIAGSVISDWDPGTLPTKGSNTTVATGIKSSSFTGTAGTVTVSGTSDSAQ